MKSSTWLLVASLAVGLGGWMITLANWSACTSPVNVGGLIMILGGIVAAWLGKSPIKPGGPQ